MPTWTLQPYKRMPGTDSYVTHIDWLNNCHTCRFCKLGVPRFNHDTHMENCPEGPWLLYVRFSAAKDCPGTLQSIPLIQILARLWNKKGLQVKQIYNTGTRRSDPPSPSPSILKYVSKNEKYIHRIKGVGYSWRKFMNVTVPSRSPNIKTAPRALLYHCEYNTTFHT